MAFLVRRRASACASNHPFSTILFLGGSVDITFRLEPGEGRLSREVLENVDNDIMRVITDRLGSVAEKSWLEAGGYVKFSKGSKILERPTGDELVRLNELPELGRLIQR
jgi:hypothetical protein